MPAAVRPITIEQGVTFREPRILKTADPDFPDDRTKDVAMDLTGYSGRSQIRDNYGAGALIAEFLVEVDVVNSKVIRSITAAEASAITSTSKKLHHDLEIYTANDEDVIRLEQGLVTISIEGTRPEPIP